MDFSGKNVILFNVELEKVLLILIRLLFFQSQHC